jgi:heavy metal translocating P-type ATPase
LRYGTVSAEFSGKSYAFCCTGCRQVFNILIEATDSNDPEKFRETELFKQCREKGIIPASEADLASKASPSFTGVLIPEAADAARSPDPADDSSQNSLDLSLKVANMWCPACAWIIDETLKKNDGIIESSCNFSTDRLYIHYDPVKTSPSNIIRTIAKLGYNANIPEESRHASERRKEFIRFSISAFLTMNIMMLSYALYSGFFTEISRETVYKLSWPAFVMATIVLVYGGFEFFKKAWHGIAHAAFSMETLVILGSMSAYVYSAINLFAGNIHIYFDTASMLITLVLLGKTLERLAKGRVLEGLENFFALKPTKARICSDLYPDGRYVSVEQLAEKDIFRVDENEIIAADGRIVSGTGAVDESTLTGEPLPVTRKKGDRVRSGTRVIKGTFRIEAERVAKDSTLGQMMNIIEKTLMTKTPLEGKTDILLQWFVPVIVALSAGTAIFCRLAGLSMQESVLRAVTVMVISCPCALGIAIPLARVAGISIAGRKGILVRRFAAFEQTEKISAFVFDKTGTITEGQWKLLDIIPAGGTTAVDALALAAGLEIKSDHFIAMEILREAERRKVRPAAAEEIKISEKGVTGKIYGKKIKIGSADFLSRELERMDPRRTEEFANDQSGHSFVYLGLGGKLSSVFIFGDRLRDDALPTVAKLKDRGYTVAMVSGDGDETTRIIGKNIGIQESCGGKLPLDKAAFISALQTQGAQVAMVGDGINDAPALVQADLSIAVRPSSQLSREAADITLMRADLKQIIEFMNFSNQVNKKIMQNLIFTFLYNAISIPIAVSGFLNPLVAVTAMLLSSISVTGNTLLLVRKNT